MSKKKGNLFEQYVDKIVLVVIGILCLLLLWIFVLGSPYSEQYEGRKYGSGDIDNYINQQAKGLKAKLEEPGEPRVYSQNRKKEFSDMVECSINKIPNNIYFPIPAHGGNIQVSDRTYDVPMIGKVTEVAVEAIRTVAHVPVEEVEAKQSYDITETELGDIDLVTVQASIDIMNLYKNFQQSFTGKRVKGDWRDDDLAQPVFAKVELQRCHLLETGDWSQWQVVPRTKIDHLKEMLEVSQKVEDLKYDLNSMMVQFREFEIQNTVLQPEPYEFASSATEWLVPSLYKEYAKLIKQEREQNRRVEQEQKREAREMARQSQQGGTMGMMGPGGGLGGPMGAPGGRTTARKSRTRDNRSTKATSRRKEGQGRRSINDSRDTRRSTKANKERTIDDLFIELDDLMVDEKTKLSAMREPLVFWAHDDTVEPGKSYQYRIRLGVFNPIAGQNWFTADQENFKDEAILWSEYSDVTNMVETPEMMHFFPLDVVSETVDEEKDVTIKVSKFHIGKWRSEEFMIHPGERIGKIVEEDSDTDEEDITDNLLGIGLNYKNTKTGPIDYSTEAVLVDVVQVNDWDGVNLRPREYEEILYTEDGISIKHLAVKNRNWPANTQKLFAKVKESEDEKIQIYYARGQGVSRRGSRKRTRQTTPSPMMGPGMMGPGMMGPGMMGPGMMGPGGR